jgi:hypothetical protein
MAKTKAWNAEDWATKGFRMDWNLDTGKGSRTDLEEMIEENKAKVDAVIARQAKSGALDKKWFDLKFQNHFKKCTKPGEKSQSKDAKAYRAMSKVKAYAMALLADEPKTVNKAKKEKTMDCEVSPEVPGEIEVELIEDEKKPEAAEGEPEAADVPADALGGSEADIEAGPADEASTLDQMFESAKNVADEVVAEKPVSEEPTEGQ